MQQSSNFAVKCHSKLRDAQNLCHRKKDFHVRDAQLGSIKYREDAGRKGVWPADTPPVSERDKDQNFYSMKMR